MAGLIGFALVQAPLGIIVALAFMFLPGVMALGLLARDDEPVRLGLLGGWAIASVAATALTGGVSGPLAGWILAPLVAALALNQRRMMSFGAALSVFALGLGIILPALGLIEAPAERFRTSLGALSMLTLTLGTAVALMPALRVRMRRAEDAEDSQQKMLRLLTEQPDLIVALDEEGRVLSAYGAVPSGLNLAQLQDQGLLQCAHGQDRFRVRDHLRLASLEGESRFGFVPYAALDRFVGVHVRKASDGRLVAVLRDDTLVHAREMALEAARAEAESLNLSKSRFLANMSHELRTPLNAVIGFSDIMRQRLFGPLSDKYADYSQSIWESGQHVLDLINDVLDMAKIEARRYELSRETFDAREPVSAAMKLLQVQAHEAGLDLRAVLPQTNLIVLADKRALKQITLNLLSNAIKFTPAGGSVSVSVLARDPWLELAVSDTGVGISPEDVARLGKPYEQAGGLAQKALGTGLGLSLVRALANLHGGDMILESTLGQGTTVTVRIPLMPEDQLEMPLVPPVTA
ncbi:MAG: sensor histidine kinase [Asticcacaulis sp.]